MKKVGAMLALILTILDQLKRWTLLLDPSSAGNLDKPGQSYIIFMLLQCVDGYQLPTDLFFTPRPTYMRYSIHTTAIITHEIKVYRSSCFLIYSHYNAMKTWDNIKTTFCFGVLHIWYWLDLILFVRIWNKFTS